MKNTFPILTLISFCLMSCASSCASCQPEQHTENPPCADIRCVTSSEVSSTSGAGGLLEFPTESGEVTDSLVDEVNSASMCTDDSSLTCHPTDEGTPLKGEVVSGDGWTITLPLGLQKKPITKLDIVLSAFSEQDKVLLVLLQEPFDGTFDEYVISSVRGVKDAGATVESSASISVNGTKFVLLEAVKNDVKIWSLVTTKNGFGYGLSCGGPSPHDAAHTVCTSITNTFTLK